MAVKPGLDLLRERLIQDIIAGALPAGSWLKHTDVEERYSVSRALVRRALDDLNARNYIQHEPNRGYRVAMSSEQQREELREVRLVLEMYAAKGVMERTTPADIQQLRGLAETFSQAVRGGTPVDQIDANSAFHERFYSIGPNKTLYNLLVEMRRRVVLRAIAPWQSVGQMEQASKDHFDMVDTLERKDLPRLRQLIDSHINP